MICDCLATFLLSIATVVALVAMYVRHAYGYWQRKNVPFLKPTFPLGNNYTFLPKGISQGIISKKFYDRFRKMGHKLGGVYLGIQPQLVVVDPDYVKAVLNSSFQHFVDRGIYYTKHDPISVNIFAQQGADWKYARSKFTSFFTAAKMKVLFDTIVHCSSVMVEALELQAEQKSRVDIMEVVGCFTTDVIGSCVFGIECNSFKHPDAEFRKMGRKVFGEFNVSDQVNLFMSIYFPEFSAKIGVRNIQKDVSEFFYRTVGEAVEYREKNNVQRQDFLQLLIDLKKSESKLSLSELVAQAFLLFLAGFETSSSTSTMVLYELSKRPDLQDKARNDVLETLESHDGQLTYEAVKDMKYLQQIVDETLRLWPPVSTLNRVCTKEYKFEDSEVEVKPGDRILISALGLQLDPEYWPEPLTFDPERFSEENKKDHVPFAYLPFGEGPRNCIGLRMGIMQTKIGLAKILRDFRVSIHPDTVEPLDLDPDTFVMHTKNKVFLSLEKI